MTTYRKEKVSRNKAEAIVTMLVMTCEGPSEAFATIAMALKIFNEELVDADSRITTEALCSELCVAINSARPSDEVIQ